MRPVLPLRGLDGANPLGFITLLGVASLCRCFCPSARISWHREAGSWRPHIYGFDGNASEFINALFATFKNTSPQPFTISKKFPFSRDDLQAAMRQSQQNSTPLDRRIADLLAAFGTDAHADGDGLFADTALRMVRSGDSNGQGLTAYATFIRNNTTIENLETALFSVWRYEDDEYSLRWDPVEDQRYALRWYDPSPQSNKKYSLRTVRGANALALEGLRLLPVQPQLYGLLTTGFTRIRRRQDFFLWPIWDTPITLDVIKSLLTLPELSQQPVPRDLLFKRGVVEVYRCERIAPNKYYKNFAPPAPA
jgi:hypothetical protein